FTHTSPTEIYTLSLHDALPICGLTASFDAARIYAILGDNGAGKTTLLRALAGLVRPTRGCISMLGTTDLSSIRPQFGYMAHPSRSEEHTSELQSRGHLVCRLLL